MISFNKNQLFVVTGASSGIGKGIALLLNELGATVVGIGRSTMRLQELRMFVCFLIICMWKLKIYQKISQICQSM